MIYPMLYFLQQEKKYKTNDNRWVKITETGGFSAFVGIVFLNIAAGCEYFFMLALAMSPDKLAGFTSDVEFWICAIGVAIINVAGIYYFVTGMAQEIRKLRQEHVKLKELVFGVVIGTLLVGEILYGLFAAPIGLILMFDTWEGLGFPSLPVDEKVAGIFLMVTGIFVLKRIICSTPCDENQEAE